MVILQSVDEPHAHRLNSSRVYLQKTLTFMETRQYAKVSKLLFFLGHECYAVESELTCRESPPRCVDSRGKNEDFMRFVRLGATSLMTSSHQTIPSVYLAFARDGDGLSLRCGTLPRTSSTSSSHPAIASRHRHHRHPQRRRQAQGICRRHGLEPLPLLPPRPLPPPLP